MLHTVVILQETLPIVRQTDQAYQCQTWHKQSPHRHGLGIFDYEFPDNDIYTVNNSCHNPSTLQISNQYVPLEDLSLGGQY